MNNNSIQNIIVGQSGGPTSVINASLLGVYQAAKERGIANVYGMVHGVKGLLGGQVINLADFIRTDLDKDLLKRTPSSFLGTCRYRLPTVEEGEQAYQTLFSLFERLHIDAFFYIGGNDSMDTVQKLVRYGQKIGSGVRFIGIPKTIDNDLACTDHTPGFGSAAKYIASTMKEIIRDGLSYDYPVISIVEIMGRNAGWLTASAALAKGEDCEGVEYLYLPERTFDMDEFLQRVERIVKQKRSAVFAVSEGIKLADGRYVCELDQTVEYVDAFGHRQLAGTARALSAAVADRMHVKTRAIELSSLQRCAAHVSARVDVTEAFNVGGAAVKAAFEGENGKMVALKRVSDDPYMCITHTVEVDGVANVEKKVPKEWLTEGGVGIDAALLRYMRPLIQAEIAPLWVDGLPRHLIFNTQI